MKMTTVVLVKDMKKLDAELQTARDALARAVNIATSGNARTHQYYPRIDNAYAIINDLMVDITHDGAKLGTPKKGSDGQIVNEY
jgi:hypothetical protein